MKLIFATHNKNKVKEVKSLMPSTINLCSLSDIDYTKDIEETASTFEGNALIKARTIYQDTGLNCFADDSGLIVDSLNGRPGVYSARYAGEPKDDQRNIDKILDELNGVQNRKAHFKSVIALILNGNEFVFEGIINGVLTDKKSGVNGFGYDPIFIPDGYQQTFAEISFEVKNKISHRALAMEKLIKVLRDYNS